MATRPPDRSEQEDAPGVTFSGHPYELGCDVHPTTRVDVDELASPGGGRGERVRARWDGEIYEFRGTSVGDLKLIDPIDQQVPEWARMAIVGIGAGRIRE